MICFLFIIEQHYSYVKVESLHNQKAIVNKIIEEEKVSHKIDIIRFNSNIATLNNAIEKIQNNSNYNYISIYITNNNNASKKDIKKLHMMIERFNKDSRTYFKRDSDNTMLADSLDELEIQHNRIILFIDSIIIKNISYDKDRFTLFSLFFITLLLTLLVNAFWQKKRLNNVYQDILFLYSMDSDRKNKTIFSQEVDAINIRMKRKSQVSDNPTMMDAITEINNNKGMVHTYTERKTIFDNTFSSVTILEIDNFSKSKRTFAQDFTQEILKKVAYSISLHEQSNDIIARTDYNQFTLIFSRPAKEQLFKDIDLVRQSIADIKLYSPDKKLLQITVTGGFILKSKNSPLEKSIRKAKELLENAKQLGTNKVLQTKDIANQNNH